MKEIIKKILKSCWLGKIVYEPIHKLYRLYSVPHRRRLLKKRGREVLSKLLEVFKKYDIPAFAAYGTLLGFYRDGGFIPNDDDIDIGIMPGEWPPKRLLELLLKEGFEFLFAFSYQGKVTEFKASYKSVPIDFFFYQEANSRYEIVGYYFFPDRQYPNDKANTVIMLNEPKVDGLKMFNVYDIPFPIPSNVEAVLEGLYGKNWRIPDAGWDEASQHPGRKELSGFGYSCTCDEVLSA